MLIRARSLAKRLLLGSTLSRLDFGSASHRVIMSGACAVLIGAAASVDPLLIRHLIDWSLPRRDMEGAFFTVLLIASCFVVRAVLSAVATLCSFKAKQLIGNKLRNELLCHITHLDPTWHEHTPIGEKLDWFRTDIEEVSYVSASAGQVAMRAGVFLVVNLFIMSRLSPAVTVAFLPVLPLFLLLRRSFRILSRRQSDAAKVAGAQALGSLAEHLDAIPQLDLLNANYTRLGVTRQAWRTELASRYSLKRTELLFSGSVTIIFALSVILVLGVGIRQVLVGTLTTGSIVAFYSYVGQIFEPIANLMDMYSQSQQMKSSIRRLDRIFGMTPVVRDTGSLNAHLPCVGTAISFEDVSVAVGNGKTVLHELCFSISAGETVAIVGKSGAGKSTLARLLVRFLDPTIGTVRVSGKDIRDYSLESLRRAVCYLPQQPRLFSGTVRENLLYGHPTASHEELRYALFAASLQSVASDVDSLLDVGLGPDGAGLSGGERQRLALARAVLRGGQIFVLDESTSALDLVTEKHVLSHFARQERPRTVIIISHRLKSLGWVDRFILMSNGRIHATGTMAELLANNLLFRDIYETDPGEEVLEAIRADS